MGKQAEYQRELQLLLSHNQTHQELETYLMSNSNLPGPRGNLELAFAFADVMAELSINQTHIDRLYRWASISEKNAGGNDPMVFLPFCALVALSAIHYKIDITRKQAIIHQLQTAANDGRWRIREAVAMGFQRIAERNVAVIVNTFSTWTDRATLPEQRAMLTALAHPPILNDDNTARFGLHLAGKIMSGLQTLKAEKRNTEAFRILKKGLGFTISVFAAYLPEAGFPFLMKWAVVEDKDIRWIIKTNLSKSRLTKHYQKQVNEILSIFNQ
ncbi:hypothetical protein JW960_14950 [candidate division KSB1 bacterium]|nr:hypothetical protein [candidate division KSB1 bacterium]